MAEPGHPTRVLERTGTQVAALVERLKAEYTLPEEPGEGTLWLDLQEAIRAAYIGRAQACGSRGGRAIVMAGAPGAGKSQAVSSAGQALGEEAAARLGLDEAGFTTIDADDIKQLLLGHPVQGLEVDPALLGQARSHWDALLAQQAPQALADGQPLARGELATLVHPLSTDTADLVRKDLLEQRFDVKIEGTLQWEGQGPRLISELETADYDRVTVVAVDAPRRVCEQGAWQRWAGPRSRGDVGARFTPVGAVRGVFSTGAGGREVCRCVPNARTTQQLAAQSAGLADADLVVVHRRQVGQPNLVEHVDRGGKTQVLQAPAARVVGLPAPSSSVKGLGQTTSGPGPASRQQVLEAISTRAKSHQPHPYRQVKPSKRQQPPTL